MFHFSKSAQALAAIGVALTASLGALQAQAQEQGRVISTQPVIQQVAVPRQVCTNQQVMVESQKSGAGGLMGAIAGGAVGSNVGSGSGRALATAIGFLGGAMMGDRIEGAPSAQMQTVQNCTTQTFYENRTASYNVVYEYGGKQYHTQMATDPGQFVQLQVTPVGGSAQGAAQMQQPMQQPIQPSVQNMGIPAPVIQPAPQAVIQQPPVIVASPQIVYAQPQVVYQQAPVGYQRPYAPIVYPSIHLGFGWRGGHGHGYSHGQHGHNRRHWH